MSLDCDVVRYRFHSSMDFNITIKGPADNLTLEPPIVILNIPSPVHSELLSRSLIVCEAQRASSSRACTSREFVQFMPRSLGRVRSPSRSYWVSRKRG